MSALSSYFSSTAVQLAALPNGLWNLVLQRTMLQKHTRNGNDAVAFQDAFDAWSQQHFKEKPATAVFQSCLSQATELTRDDKKCLQIQQEMVQAQSLQASILVGTRVTPQEVALAPHKNAVALSVENHGMSMQ